MPCTPQNLKIRHTWRSPEIGCTQYVLNMRHTQPQGTLYHTGNLNTFCGPIKCVYKFWKPQYPRIWVGLEYVSEVQFKWHRYEYGTRLVLRGVV